MDATAVVTLYWQRLEQRDWPGVGALLADDVVLEWPVSAEVVRGRDNVVGVNAAYPEGWSIRVLRVVGSGGEAATEVEVPMKGVGTFRVASFWAVADGRITWGREYWTSPGADEAPQWRRRFVDPA